MTAHLTWRAAGVTLCGMVLASTVQAQTWSAAEVQLLHGTRYQEPYNPQAVSKSILTLQHAQGYSFGRHFLFVDVLHSNASERNLAGEPEAPSEVYGEAYGTLSLSRVTGRDWSAGPVADVGLTAGINAGHKRSQLEPRPRVYLAGVTLDMAVPRGFLNVDILSYHDHGCHDGIHSCPAYRPTYQISPAWNLPFSVGGQVFEFTGFADFIGSRGEGTVSQVLSQPQLRMDVGRYWGQPGKAYAGIEYQYWRNKFGVAGVHEHHPQLLLAWKF